MPRKKLSESLTARIFLITAGILLFAGTVTFGLIAWATPSTYTAVVNDDLAAQVDTLAERLADTTPEDCGALLDGRPLELTTREFELLHTFLDAPGRVFTREMLLAKLWGYDFYGDERVVDSHIKNLRHKLGRDYIETVRGVGYRAAKEDR